MADIRPFRALRYDPAVAGDPARLVAPPYDVVAGRERLELYARSPYNVSRVDYAEDRPDLAPGMDHYAVAHRDLSEWIERRVLCRDAEPRLYVYDQEFTLDGVNRTRRAVFCALRLEPWEKGVVLPHEVTGAGAKLDRMRLLQATRVQLSPVLALHAPDGVPAFTDKDLDEPVLDAVLPAERHILRPVKPEAAAAFCAAFQGRKLYLADGHHRYETALAYRDEWRAAAANWTGEEPENFILAALVSIADPGLVILPTHRLVRLPKPLRVQLRSLRLFSLEDGGVANEPNLEALMRRLREAGGAAPAFGAIGLEPGRLHLLTPRDPHAVIARTPADHPMEWRRLDVTVLAHAVLPALGFDGSPENIDYTESHHRALEAVSSGEWDVAFLLNPTPVEQVIAVAETGDRMPRKSTYFYPKLATGVVMRPLD
ncbi:MAG TPA: DUF1015 domain-containing protein [Dehalococcoidia bacterium]|nr:DUF1015 domain-containing protein [Dehalococcoidia bacterium]